MATDERFVRTEKLLGPEGLRRLREARVVVVGLGAVGSYATEGIARAGVGNIRLVDFDVVRESNINRQLYALGSTVGKPKTELARQRVLDINPSCKIEVLNTFVHTDTLPQVLAGNPTIVIDAIDSMLPKVELLAALVRAEIPVISSMGAALRTDPSAVRVGLLKHVRYCPVARRVRRDLRRRSLPLDVLCVHSLEPLTQLPSTAISDDPADNEDIVERGRRRRVLGSLPTLTGIFGLFAANAAIRHIVNGSVNKDDTLGV